VRGSTSPDFRSRDRPLGRRRATHPSFWGPGLFDLDFSLFKVNYIRRISESFNIQLRTEFFNVLNRPSFQSPIDNNALFNNDGTPIGGAGAIDATTTSSREIQFGIKIIW
jgi:hypothetical protein